MMLHLEGVRFNHLTVIQSAGTDGREHRLWKCKCDCGNITYAITSQLKNGHKKSCGCLKRQSHAIDLKGQRFGLLTVTKRTGTDKHRKALWRCKCDCGKTAEVSSADLKSGNTKSCGCLGRNLAKRNLIEGGFWYDPQR